MSAPKLKIADFGTPPEEITNSAGRKTFRRVEVTWSRPKVWERGDSPPIDGAEHSGVCLYAIIADHHRSASRERILYIGITTRISSRFDNHPKALALSSKKWKTALSIGSVNFCGYRTAINNPKPAIEQLEHLYVWVLIPEYNEKNAWTFPGMGMNRGRAWHVINGGHRFAGQMPLEIIYPWILVKPGRDRSLKRSG